MERKINKIVIFTLDSLYSNILLDKLIKEFEDKIVLICLSRRFGGKYGSFFYQLKKNLKKSGLHFVNYITFYLILYKFFIYVAAFINRVLFREKKIHSINQLANKYNISTIKTYDINSSEVVEIIKKYEPDLIITSYFDQVVGKEVINIPKVAALNIHFAWLPDYRGPFPAIFAVLNGEKKFGATIHYMDETLDTGPIIIREWVDIKPSKSILDIDCQVLERAGDMAINAIKIVSKGNIEAIEHKDKGKYYSYPKRCHIKELRKKHKIKLFQYKDFIKYFV